MRADRSEAALLARFTARPVFQEIELRPQSEFLAMLLQRRFLSLMFPAIWDIAIDGLTDDTAIRVVRQILREEYPDASGETPSHREDLVHDLVVLGATKPEIFACRPTPVTAAVIRETFALMGDVAAEMSDVKLLTILRFWGEVLVSVEYGEYWKRMAAQFRNADTRSLFYYGHHHHDGREPLATASESSPTHSGRLGACLKRLLDAEDAEDQFVEAENRVLALRLKFYDQFQAGPLGA